ncbi:MAG: hypothetical protein AABW72_01640 [archaeon]
MEIIWHLIQFDIIWFVDLLLANLHWAFAFFALGFIFFNGKNPWKKFIVLATVPLIWEDFSALTGIVLFITEFLAIYYVIQIATLRFAEDYPQISNKLHWVEEFFTMALVLLFNFGGLLWQ